MDSGALIAHSVGRSACHGLGRGLLLLRPGIPSSVRSCMVRKGPQCRSGICRGAAGRRRSAHSGSAVSPVSGAAAPRGSPQPRLRVGRSWWSCWRPVSAARRCLARYTVHHRSRGRSRMATATLCRLPWVEPSWGLPSRRRILRCKCPCGRFLGFRRTFCSNATPSGPGE